MREVTKENWGEVTAAGTVLIDVWGPGCAPCVAMLPQVEQYAAEMQTRKVLEVVKLDSSKNRRLCIDHRIMGLPAFLLFRDGKEVGRIGGNDVTFDRMTKWVAEYLDSLPQTSQPN